VGHVAPAIAARSQTRCQALPCLAATAPSAIAAPVRTAKGRQRRWWWCIKSLRGEGRPFGRRSDAVGSVCRSGFEGVVAKRLSNPYRPGRRDWIKIKNREYWRFPLEVAAMASERSSDCAD